MKRKDYFGYLVVTQRIILRWIVTLACGVDLSVSGYSKYDKDDVQHKGSHQDINFFTSLITVIIPRRRVLDEGNYLSNYMIQSTSLEANRSSSTQEIPRMLCKLGVRYHTHKSSPHLYPEPDDTSPHYMNVFL
jgi:hypothetical protein